jgi:hypothetical protein
MKKLLLGIILGVAVTAIIGHYQSGLVHYFSDSPTSLHRRQQVSQQMASDIKSNLHFNSNAFLIAAMKVEKGDQKAFDNQMYELGQSLNQSIDRSLHLSPAAKKEMDSLLKANYPDIAASARQDYLAKVQTLKTPDVNQFSSTSYSTRAEILASTINSTTCSFANLIFIPLNLHFSLSTNIATSYFMQSPCEFILAGIMEPIGQQLYKTGIVKDLELTQTKLSIEKAGMLTELATSQIDVKVNGAKIITRSIDIGKYNLTKYEAASLKISYEVTVKYGYDLSKQFKIERDDEHRTITVFLPQSHLVDIKLDPVITEANSGMFAEINNSHYRLIYEHAQDEAIKLAERQGIKEQAKKAMETVVSSVFLPFTANARLPYKINFNYTI